MGSRGIDLGGRLEMRVGFVGLAEQEERAAQIVLGNEVSVGYGERMGPEIVVARPVIESGGAWRKRARAERTPPESCCPADPFWRESARSAAAQAIITKIPMSGM